MISRAKLLADRSAVFIALSGKVTLADPYKALRTLRERGELQPGMPVLLDLAGIRSIDRDPAQEMRLNLDIVDMLRLFGEETVLLIHAPEGIARDMASAMLDFWEGSEVVIVRICEDELGALMILRRPERSFAELKFTQSAIAFAKTDDSGIF
ncbi:MAG: hypothetical protein AAFR50_00940 [Pseudomonadota bacterium]